MKKKPPPGATLIARLREQRLAREAALQDKLTNGTTTTDEAPAAVPVETTEQPKGSKKTAAKKTSVAVEVEKEKETTIDIESVRVEEPPDAGSAAVAIVSNGKRDDLIHREIEIEDLRPTTDDYFVLTDEIRLAGRFAAVGLIAQGLRLTRLKEQAIYKDHYQTFEDYCRKEHQMSATYAYRLMRMADMAERLAVRGESINAEKISMPDPFEMMLGLGHRHLMALLPLEPEAAEELLTKGVPLSEPQDGADRVPINHATERQIKEALRIFTGAPTKPVSKKPAQQKALASEKQLIPALNKLVEMIEDWSGWLAADPAELKAARIGRGPLLNKLAKRFRNASGRIADALENNEHN